MSLGAPRRYSEPSEQMPPAHQFLSLGGPLGSCSACGQALCLIHVSPEFYCFTSVLIQPRGLVSSLWTAALVVNKALCSLLFILNISVTCYIFLSKRGVGGGGPDYVLLVCGP